MNKVVIDYEQKTGAMRLMAREWYEKGRIGKARMDLMVEIADELDNAKKELSFSRNARQKTSVREFMADIAANAIVEGKKYDVRIEINDGGDNSYIGLCVDTEDFHRNSPVTRGVRLFRHSNSVDRLINTWGFDLGGVCNAYADYPEIPVEFSSYGKSPDEAETEALKYFDELKKLIRKKTSDYKIQMAETAKEEREKILSRLAQLDEVEAGVGV